MRKHSEISDRSKSAARADRREDSDPPSPLEMQARLLAVRLGLAPGVAELIAGFAYQTGARR